MARSIEKIVKEQEKLIEEQRKKDIAASDSMYDTQIKVTQDEYGSQINDTHHSYEDLYRENAVNKIITEKQIAENMANLGLTDSGLSRTQQTAAQLAYGNRKNKIDITRQKAVDKLTDTLAATISQLSTEKVAAAEGIRSGYQNTILQNAQTIRADELEQETEAAKAALEAETQRQKLLAEIEIANQKAQIEAETARQKAYYSAVSKQASSGSSSSSGSGSKNKTILYTYGGEDGSNENNNIFYDSNGKKRSMAKGVSPYTGTINPDIYARDKNGKIIKTKKAVFSNGYQPNNVGGSKLSRTGATTEVNGKSQNIWRSAAGLYYYWDGTQNSYIQLNAEEIKAFGLS